MNKVLYCFWFGDPMSEDRRRCYESILKNVNVEVVLVTESNVMSFEKAEHPFHPAFNFLSPVHKSDYLRPYFMYFYGGGYTDIKNTSYDWNPYLDLLEQSDKVAIGYREKSPGNINYPAAKLVYDQILGTGVFAHKKGSHLAKKWVGYTEYIMTEKYERLISNKEYPFEYTELAGDVWHRVQVENLGDWLFDLPYVDMNNYR